MAGKPETTKKALPPAEPTKKRRRMRDLFKKGDMKKVQVAGKEIAVPKGYTLRKAGSNPDKLPRDVVAAFKGFWKKDGTSLLEGLAVFVLFRYLWGRFIATTTFVAGDGTTTNPGHPALNKWAGFVSGLAGAATLVLLKRKKSAVLVTMTAGTMETLIRYGADWLADKPDAKKQLGLDTLAGKPAIDVPYQIVKPAFAPPTMPVQAGADRDLMPQQINDDFEIW